jgi:hypothetical protein
LSIIAQDRHGPRQLGASLTDGLPDLSDGKLSQLFSPLFRLVGHLGQSAAAVSGGLLAPPQERFAGARDGLLDASLTGLLKFSDDVGWLMWVDALH